MNKKFLSAILFGAMLVTAIGTFVSCKDYDDDIENLQSQIDNLSSSSSSLSSSLSSVQSTLESQLSSAQSTLQSQISSVQSALQSAIADKADASEISSLASELSTLEQDYAATTSTLNTQIGAAQTAIAGLQAASSNAGSKEAEEELQEAIDAANAVLAALTGTTSSDDAETVKAVAANMQIQYDALVQFKADVESADFQSQINYLGTLINSNSGTTVDASEFTEQINRVDSVMTVLEAQINANITNIDSLQVTMESLSTTIKSINPNLDAITLLVVKGVTSIELVYSYSALKDEDDTDLSFTNGIEQSNTFGYDADGNKLTSAITFTAGQLYKKSDSFIVRVSPINATLDASMIKFVNSQKGTLDDIVTVTEVAKYTKLLTKATDVETGLWEITVEVADDLTKAAFWGATNTKADGTGDHVLFAVQVNNTLDDYAERYVTSSYDLTLDWDDYVAIPQLWYTVGSTAVENINNRYYQEYGNSFYDPGNTAYANYNVERRWYIEGSDSGYSSSYPTPAVSDDSSHHYALEDTNDDRANQQLYQGVVGEDIVIKLVDHDAIDANGNVITDSNGDDVVYKAENIRALYVTLDYEDNAVESAPSEWNAWNSYTYEGLNEVIDAKETGYPLSATIKVTSAAADGDIIGFRVFAVNYDGTLVDPDGKAFYVALGDAGTSWNAVATTIVPEGETIYDTTSDKVAVSLTELVNPTTYTWATTPSISGGTSPCFNIVMLNSSNQVVAYTENGSLTTTSNFSGFSKVTKIYTTILSDPDNTSSSSLNAWTSYTDNSAYTGTLTIANSNGRILASLTVSMKKVLPTGMPTDFSIKTGQVQNGIYYGYLVPDNWAAGQATTGTMDMDQIFNFFGANDTYDANILANYYVDFATSDDTTTSGVYTDTKSVAGDGTLAVDAVLVDNTTYHATEVGYNYGDISSVSGNNPYKVPAATFKSVYISIYAANAFTWNWATLAQLNAANGTSLTTLPYSTELTYGNSGQTVDISYIFGISQKDSEYDAKGLDSPYMSSLDFVSATLTSDSNGLPEYFDVTPNGTTLEFDPSPSSATNPMVDVPSTLTLTYVDSYGNPVVIELAMTVKRRLD